MSFAMGSHAAAAAECGYPASGLHDFPAVLGGYVLFHSHGLCVSKVHTQLLVGDIQLPALTIRNAENRAVTMHVEH